jgi:hypothetical protein
VSSIYLDLRLSALSGGARSGLINSGIAASELILVLVLEAIDTATAVQLGAEDLISLTEALEFPSKVGVLALKTASVLLKGVSLAEEISVIGSVLAALHAKVLNFSAGGIQGVLLLLKADLGVSNLDGDVGVAALLEVNFFAEVVVLAGDTVVVSSEGTVLAAELGVVASHAGELSLSVFKSNLHSSKLGAASVKKLLGVVNAGLGAGKIEVETLKLLALVSSFSGAVLVHLLKASDLSPHLSALHFDRLDLALKIVEGGSGIGVRVSLLNSLVAETASLEVLLIKEAFRSGKLVIQIEVLLGPTRRQRQVRILISNGHFRVLTCR